MKIMKNQIKMQKSSVKPKNFPPAASYFKITIKNNLIVGKIPPEGREIFRGTFSTRKKFTLAKK